MALKEYKPGYDNHRVEPPKTPAEGYHLTEDLADKAIAFSADSKQVAPTKRFFMYFATGAMPAPHHVPKEWADKYAGQFDDGWETYREKVFARQKEMGIVLAEAELSRHDPDVPRRDSCSPEEKKLYARRLAGGLPLAGAVLRRGGPGFWDAHPRRKTDRTGRRRLGTVSRRAELGREPRGFLRKY